MINLSKFTPDVFNNLTSNEKKEAIKGLASDIFKKFDIKPIPVLFDNLDGDKTKSGVFYKHPACIFINNFFIDEEAAKTALSDVIDHKKFLSYYLVNTIAHECYHYYQYCLINKLVNKEDLSQDDLDFAYLQFISLYGKTFRSFCKEKELLLETSFDEDTLYKFCPSELSADDFASKIVDQLSNLDSNKDNYDYYAKVMDVMYYFSKPKDKKIKFEDLKIMVIKYNLQVALCFLEYKNQTSGLKKKYLDIEEEDLKESIYRTIDKLEKQNAALNELLKKISKINKK